MAKEKPLRITDEEVAQLCHAITIACGDLIGQVEKHEALLGEHARRLFIIDSLWESDKKGVDYIYKQYKAIEDWVGQLHERIEYLAGGDSSHTHSIDSLWAEIQNMQTPWYVRRWRQLVNLVRPPESF